MKSHTTSYRITANRESEWPMGDKTFNDAQLNIHQLLQLLPRTFFEQIREAVITTKKGVNCKLTTRPLGDPDDRHLEVRITINAPAPAQPLAQKGR